VIYSVDVRIETPVNDTEVTDRVADAVQNVFPDAEPVHEDSRMGATTHTLDAFADVLYEQEILDTARRVFTQNATESGFSFDLKNRRRSKASSTLPSASRMHSVTYTSTCRSASQTSTRLSTTSRPRPTMASRSTPFERMANDLIPPRVSAESLLSVGGVLPSGRLKRFDS